MASLRDRNGGGGGGDIEDLATRALANELANFTIADDSELEEDYDSITSNEDEDEHLVGHDNDGYGEDAEPGDDFALAARTNQIISSYRNYLTDMEAVSAENQRLTNEMSSLRGSLGVQKVSRDPPADDRRDLQFGIEIHEEYKSTRYSHPLLRSRQVKKRLLGAVVGLVVIIGSVAVLFSKASSAHHHQDQKNLPNWDQELVEARQQEEETKEALMEEAGSRARGPFSIKLPAPHPSEAGGVENPAMKIIQEMMKHPDDITVTSKPREIVRPKHDATKDAAGGESGKSKSSKSIRPSKSKSSKSDTPESKSGKTSKSEHTRSSEHSMSQSISMSYSMPTISYNESKSGTESNNSNTAPKSSKSNSVNASSSSLPKEKRSHTPVPDAPVLEDGGRDVARENRLHLARENRLHLEAASILYKAISSKYNPIFYDRTQGWEGKHFREAAEFCASNYPSDEGVGVPCPFEAYCPEGANSLPFGGYRTDLTGDGIYAPILDDTEHWLGWVQLSDGHPCAAYNNLNPEPNEEQTGHIMCCRDISR